MPASTTLSAQESQVVEQQAATLAASGSPAVQKDQFVFFAGFDGTRNDRADLGLSGTPQPTNVAELADQVRSAAGPGASLVSGYFPGHGTAASLPGSAFDPTQVTQEAINTATAAYDQFARQASAWLDTNPGGSVTAMMACFSRGCASGVIFSQLLWEKGLVTADGRELIPPGQVGVTGGVMYDPVYTGMQGNMSLAPNVQNIAVIRASDEFRIMFQTPDFTGQPGVTVHDFIGNHGDIAGFYDNGVGSLTLESSTQYLRNLGLSIGDVRSERSFDPNAPLKLHTEGVDGFGNRVWDEYGTRGNRLIAQVGTPATVQIFDDGTRLVTFKDVRGNVVYTSLDEHDAVVSSRTVLAAVDPLIGTLAQTMGDVTSLINAIKSGHPLPVLSSGLTLLNNLDRSDGVFDIPSLNTTTNVIGGLASVYSLANAFQSGSDLSKLSATLSTINYFNDKLPYLFTGNAATQPLSQGLSEVLNGTPLNSVAGGMPGALAALGLITAIKNDDPIGAAMSIGTMIQGSAFLTTNPIGWALLAASFVKAMQEPPEAWGVGTFKFADDGTTELELDAQGESFGVDRVASLMDAMKGYLDRVIESSQQSDPNHPLGIIPQRLGTLTWREARLGDAGYSLREPGPITGQESLDFLRYNDDLTPYNADPTIEAQRRSLLERMVVSAIDREAIAPMWEVNTARLQQDNGDPNAGLTEEVRAARRGLLAPIDQTTNLPTAGAFRPIALDLDGDGRITTVADADNDRALNWDGSGYDKQVGWVGAGEGLLWLDRNPNGVVDSGKELFSNSTVADAAKGIRSLSWVDANADGMIDASDPVFAQLKVWQDADGDATADYDELQGMEALGITSLDYANGRYTRNGQHQALQSQDLQASPDGTRVSVVPEGIRVEFSNGQTTVFVTNVLDLGKRPPKAS